MVCCTSPLSGEHVALRYVLLVVSVLEVRLKPLDQILDAVEALAVKGQPVILNFDVFSHHFVLFFDVEEGDELRQLARTSEIVVDDAGVLLSVELESFLYGVEGSWQEFTVSGHILHVSVDWLDVVFDDLVEAVVYAWLAAALDSILEVEA